MTERIHTFIIGNVLPVQEYIDQVCRNLSKLEMKVCTITHPQLTDEHVLHFSGILQSEPVSTRLRKLDIHHCPKISSDGVVALCEAVEQTSVSHLSFQGINVGREAIVALTQLIERKHSGLKMLSLEGTLATATAEIATDQIWIDFMEVAGRLLESLDLSRNGFSSSHLSGLVDALKTKTCTLKALILSENPISDDGFYLICKALQENHSLVLLACAECGLSKEVVSSALLECLRSNQSIQRLYLYGNAAGSTLTAEGNEEARHWLELNSNGRSFVGGVDFRPEYLPFVLNKVSKDPSLIQSLLIQTPHSITRSSTLTSS